MPPLMSNHGNYIVSLSNVCKWLATEAEALGVEIYPGIPGGRSRHRKRRGEGASRPAISAPRTAITRTASRRGMNILGKYTLFAEGARGSLSKRLLADYNLTEGATIRSLASA